MNEDTRIVGHGGLDITKVSGQICGYSEPAGGGRGLSREIKNGDLFPK
jgi:hypothetical protein